MDIICSNCGKHISQVEIISSDQEHKGVTQNLLKSKTRYQAKCTTEKCDTIYWISELSYRDV